MSSPRTNPRYRANADFTALAKAYTPASNKEGLSHTIQKVKYNKDQKTYFQKLSQKSRIAAIESTAGQIYHLLMPYQPKTFLSKDAKGRIYVNSEEKEGFISMQKISRKELKRDLNSGALKGFGSMMMASYFLNEVDSKVANMGYAKVNEVWHAIKIDSDWSLAALRDPSLFLGDDKKTHEVTTRGLILLPLMNDYKTHNLLDRVDVAVDNDAYLKGSKQFRLIEPDLAYKPHFRQEVNECIMKILLMPASLIAEITNQNSAYSEELKELTLEIIDRQDQVLHSVIHNLNFRNYLNSSEADLCFEKTLKDYEQFVATYELPQNCLPSQEELRNKFDQLHLSFNYADLFKLILSGEAELKRIPAGNHFERLEKLCKQLDLVNKAETYNVVIDLLSDLEDNQQRQQETKAAIKQEISNIEDLVEKGLSAPLKGPEALKLIEMYKKTVQETIAYAEQLSLPTLNLKLSLARLGSAENYLHSLSLCQELDAAVNANLDSHKDPDFNYLSHFFSMIGTLTDALEYAESALLPHEVASTAQLLKKTQDDIREIVEADRNNFDEKISDAMKLKSPRGLYAALVEKMNYHEALAPYIAKTRMTEDAHKNHHILQETKQAVTTLKEQLPLRITIELFNNAYKSHAKAEKECNLAETKRYGKEAYLQATKLVDFYSKLKDGKANHQRYILVSKYFEQYSSTSQPKKTEPIKKSKSLKHP